MQKEQSINDEVIYFKAFLAPQKEQSFNDEVITIKANLTTNHDGSVLQSQKGYEIKNQKNFFQNEYKTTPPTLPYKHTSLYRHIYHFFTF